MKSSVAYSMNNQPQASFGRHFSHACHTSVILSADVGKLASAFCFFVDIIVRRIIDNNMSVRDMRILRKIDFRII